MSQLAKQTQMVLDYLRSGRALTQIVAITTLKVMALPKRISELAEAGYTIVKERKRDFQGTEYTSYTLAPEVDPNATTKAPL